MAAWKCVVLVTWQAGLEAGRGRGRETMDRREILGDSKWRFLLAFSFWRSPLTRNFRDYNGNVYTWYCHLFKHERFFLCWQRKRCRVEQSEAVFWLGCVFAGNVFMQIHEINRPDWKVSKETVEFMESKYGSRAKQVLAILECLLWLTQERTNIWWERPTLSLYPNAIGKTLSLTNDRMRTNIGRALTKTYTGDLHFHNLQYW